MKLNKTIMKILLETYSGYCRVFRISLFSQWSYGVTMWEIFSGGKAPYPGIHPTSVIEELEQGYRMPKPYNFACSDEM